MFEGLATQPHRRALFVVITIGFLTGCGSIPGDGVARDADQTGVTPAPVPTEVSSPTPVEALVPGLTRRGVIDPLALAEAHESFLASRSETVRLRRVIRYENGDLRSRRVQVTRVTADRRRFHTVITVAGPHPPFFGDRLEFYSDGQTVVQATVLPNRTSFFRIPLERYRAENDIDVVLSSPDAGTVFLLFAAIETRMTVSIERSGRTRYRLRGTRLLRPGMLAEAEDVRNPRNVSLSAVVDDRGVLLEYSLRFDATLDDRNVTVAKSGSHSAIGNTTVEPPEWLARARNRTA